VAEARWHSREEGGGPVAQEATLLLEMPSGPARGKRGMVRGSIHGEWRWTKTEEHDGSLTGGRKEVGCG
jgi:hypothetical protein